MSRGRENAFKTGKGMERKKRAKIEYIPQNAPTP